MGEDTYLVLRITTAQPKGFESVGSFGVRGLDEPGLEEEVEYQVEARTLDPHDYREASRDPEVAGLARPMPLRLIAPVAAPEAAAAGIEPEPAHAEGATWGVAVTGALQSPRVGYGVTVAVLDTGIDADHEAFAGVELVQKDFTGEGDGDENGHGTHVAGTIFGRATGGLRYSVAPGVSRALIGKVLGVDRSATTAELVDAIQWAVQGGTQVINMSLAVDFPGLVQWWVGHDLEVDLATSRALAQYRDNVRFFDKLVGLLQARTPYGSSALLVAAAGNESRRQIRPDYAIEVAAPAAADGIVSVAAVGTTGPPHDALAVAPFSNIRAAVAGPGMGVYSARAGGGYTYKNGTSMASPHVTGVAALWAERQFERSGTVNAVSLDYRLRGKARLDRLGDASFDDVGEGLVAAPVD
jgi:subtilisin family serine protease